MYLRLHLLSTFPSRDSFLHLTCSLSQMWCKGYAFNREYLTLIQWKQITIFAWVLFSLGYSVTVSSIYSPYFSQAPIHSVSKAVSINHLVFFFFQSLLVSCIYSRLLHSNAVTVSCIYSRPTSLKRPVSVIELQSFSQTQTVSYIDIVTVMNLVLLPNAMLVSYIQTFSQTLLVSCFS